MSDHPQDQEQDQDQAQRSPADDEKERWRQAWEQQEQHELLRQQQLKRQRQELLSVLIQVEEELRQLDGQSGWAASFKPLKALNWLHQTPPPQRVLLSYLGQCMLPLGKVGFFVGEGGIGKSWALTQLAIAVATGVPWFEQFSVPADSQGAVLMLMAEEDPDEMHRRLFHIVDHMGLAAHHRSNLEQRLYPMPLAGHFVEFLEEGERSPNHERFWQLAQELCPEEGWRLIILDPASRFMGMDAEKDNAFATRFVQLLEQLTKLPGQPTVLCAHHTNKMARVSQKEGARAGAARGASALTDGARWQGNLFGAEDAQGELIDDEVFFSVTKSNYGPKPPLLKLKRKAGSGVLVPVDPQEQLYTKDVGATSYPSRPVMFTREDKGLG